MLIITQESAQALRDRLMKAENLEQCQDELKKMIEIKQALLWRAERSCACVGTALPANLAWEAQTLEDALAAVERGKVVEAAALLDAFISRLELNKDHESTRA